MRPEPDSPQWIGWWAAERVYEAKGEGLALWVRYVNGGFGWLLTDSPLRAPVGRYRLAAWVDYDQAARVLGHIQHHYESQFTCLSRLVQTVSDALDAERRAA